MRRIVIKRKRKQRWMSRGIKICCKNQRNLLWRYRKRPTTLNKANFVTYSKRLKKIIRLSKKAQNNDLIRTSDNKSKATWQIINQTKSCYPKEPINTIKLENVEITNPADIANAFNDFFIDQVEKTSMKCDPTQIKIPTVSESMFMPPVSLQHN